MNQQGTYASIYSTNAELYENTFKVNRHRLGILVLAQYNDSFDFNHVFAKVIETFVY